MAIFYKPADGWAGDFIPFYWQGEYHLFYLKDYRDRAGHGEGTPWFHLATRDFVHFTDYGEALPRGTVAEQDLYVFTGCVYAHEGQFHIFYTGHNPHLRAAGKPEQAVMHATSPDLIHWQKDPANPILLADTTRYEPHDWRDPFVFWHAATQEHWMLLAARRREGPDNRRGITALCTSKDLINWEIRDPFWAPDLYFTHECPDVFQMGAYWYQVYSTFSERMLTHYRLSRDLQGPWLAPVNDSFDGRAFYAAKTATDGVRRLAFGWIPTRTGEDDTGSWNWGGNLVVHEVQQQADGALTVRPPVEVLAHFDQMQRLSAQPQIGDWTLGADTLTATAPDRFAWCRLGAMPGTCRIEAQIQFAADTRAVGLVLRADAALDRYYMLRLEPGRQRIIFERWPRPGDEPPIIERPIQIDAQQPVQLRILCDDTIFVAYVNDEVALSARGYAHRDGDLGVFVAEGAAAFSHLQLRTPSE